MLVVDERIFENAKFSFDDTGKLFIGKKFNQYIAYIHIIDKNAIMETNYIKIMVKSYLKL